MIDDSLRLKLDECRYPAEVCDAAGRILGVYLPAEHPDKRWYDWARGQHSEEELERLANEPGGKTLAEILESLQYSCGGNTAPGV
jgi:hypothetical protein